jgi:hypothetical protein
MASTDWMPGARSEILAMCMKWMAYMTEERPGVLREAFYGKGFSRLCG